jgi:hypothetical protein
MFFYLGAKFGPKMFRFTENYIELDDTFLPDDKEAEEIKALLKEKKHKFVFFEALQTDKPNTIIYPSASTPKVETKIAQQKEKKETKKEQKKEIVPVKVVKKKVMPVAVKVVKKEEKPVQKKEETKQVEQQKIAQEENVMQPEDNRPIYSIQLGSYNSEKKAARASNVWQERGYEARVIKTSVTGKKSRYRLRIGLYPNIDDAVATQSKMMTSYRQQGRIVKLRKK